MIRDVLALLALMLLTGCKAPRAPVREAVHVRAGTSSDWRELCDAIETAHPGLEAGRVQLLDLEPCARPRLLLIVMGSGPVGVQRQSTRVARVLEPGDLVFLRAHQRLSTESSLQALELRLETPLPAGLPTFVGFAERMGLDVRESGGWEEGRTDVLAWLPDEAPAYRGVNVKLVQLGDAPTHYHPKQGGFDEVVFVREAEGGAGVLISAQREAIEARTLGRSDLAEVFRPLAVSPGDLLFVPRGLVHRPRGRSAAVVLALPGFLPGAEVRLDADLRAINEALDLEGDFALPTYSPPARP